MEKENPQSTTPSCLPPGCRFRPSDHQLLSDYLASKNSNPDGCSHRIIEEMEFYDLGPSQLPDSASFWFGRMGRRQHWFCFVKRNRKGKSRLVQGRGRWRRKGKARDIVVGGNVLGTRTAFVFYEMGGLGNTVRTDWVLHEYAQADSNEASFVLCRVFRKHPSGSCTCQGTMNLNGEPSALATTHHDTQIDRDIRLIPAGEDINTIHSNSMVSVELNVHINNGPAAPDVEPLGLVRLPEIIIRTAANQEIRSIMEEDFLELNDLIEPLPRNFD